MLTSHLVRTFRWAAGISTAVALFAGGSAFAQGGPHGRGQMMGDSSHMADMGLIHEWIAPV
jgi:hypothetical protein